MAWFDAMSVARFDAMSMSVAILPRQATETRASSRSLLGARTVEDTDASIGILVLGKSIIVIHHPPSFILHLQHHVVLSCRRRRRVSCLANDPRLTIRDL